VTTKIKHCKWARILETNTKEYQWELIQTHRPDPTQAFPYGTRNVRERNRREKRNVARLSIIL
jgi:hypothetical protein